MFYQKFTKMLQNVTKGYQKFTKCYQILITNVFLFESVSVFVRTPKYLFGSVSVFVLQTPKCLFWSVSVFVLTPKSVFFLKLCCVPAINRYRWISRGDLVPHTTTETVTKIQNTKYKTVQAPVIKMPLTQ